MSQSKRVKISSGDLKHIVQKLVLENYSLSHNEMSPISPGAREYLEVLTDAYDFFKKSGINDFKNLIASVSSMQELFVGLLKRELSSEYWDALNRRFNFRLAINRVVNDGGDLHNYLGIAIEPLANQLGIKQESASNTLRDSVEKIAPDMTVYFLNEAERLRSMLESLKNPADAKINDREKIRYAKAVQNSVIETVLSDDLIAGFLDLAMDGETLPPSIPKHLSKKLMTIAEITFDRKGLPFNTVEEHVRDRFLAYFDAQTKSKPPDDIANIANELIVKVNKFPSLARKIRQAMQSSKEEIEQFAKAPADAPFGKIAFAPERMKRENVPYEPNTDIERKVRDDILGYVYANDEMDPDNVELLRNLVKNNLYDDVIQFSDPSIGALYRGVAIGIDGIKEMGTNLSLNLSGIRLGELRNFDIDMTYKSRNRAKLSSWTEDPEIACSFAITVGESLPESQVYVIVLHAQIIDNPGVFLNAHNLFKKIDVKRKEILDEREHFGLDNIKVTRITVSLIKPQNEKLVSKLLRTMPSSVKS